MKFHILTLFPDMVRQGLETSIIGRAVEKRLIELNTVNIRDFTQEKHGRVDDYPYGGGAGMLMQAQPVFDAWKSVCGEKAVDARADNGMEKDAVSGKRSPIRTVYVTPQGEPFTQRKARELAGEEELVILCGHYEGIDERVLEETVTDYITIGDYVLTGGELAAMVIVDAVGRLVPGVLGNETSAEAESFHRDLLEYPQYSRPEVWHGKKVPEVLLSGNHGKVNQWRLERAKERTAAVRPDLYLKYEEKQAVIRRLAKEKRNHIHIMESLDSGRGEILYRKGAQLLVEDREAKVCMLLCEENTCECAKLLSEIPVQTELLVVLHEQLAAELTAIGFEILGKCSQYLYTTGKALPVRHRDIRRLTRDDLTLCKAGFLHIEKCQRMELFPPNDSAVRCGMPGNMKKYVEDRIQAGALYGAFADGRLTGFIGTHAAGGMGMLYVEEAYRGRGIGESLVSYQINRTLEQGRIPYAHVPEGSRAAEGILEKLGLYRAGKAVWWLVCKEILSRQNMLP